MNDAKKERPALDHMGPYNIPRSDIPDASPHDDGEAWAETEKIHSLEISEFYEVRDEIVAALSRHGKAYGECEGDPDFFVYDDKFFDRTQKIEIEATDRLAEFLVPAIAELQGVLRKHSLWRVMFIGDGHDRQAQEQFFVVYPDVVRIRQLQLGKSVDQALVENVQIRLRHEAERKEHLRQRDCDLKIAIARTFLEMDNSSDDLRLVAWFTTVSAVDWDWGWEGKPGTSVWLLLGRNLPDTHEVVQADIDFSTWWALPDGRVTRVEPEALNARQLLHFEDNERVRGKLEIQISGKSVLYIRP